MGRRLIRILLGTRARDDAQRVALRLPGNASIKWNPYNADDEDEERGSDGGVGERRVVGWVVLFEDDGGCSSQGVIWHTDDVTWYAPAHLTGASWRGIKVMCATQAGELVKDLLLCRVFARHWECRATIFRAPIEGLTERRPDVVLAG
jgi:hypothetical protein